MAVQYSKIGSLPSILYIHINSTKYYFPGWYTPIQLFICTAAKILWGLSAGLSASAFIPFKNVLVQPDLEHDVLACSPKPLCGRNRMEKVYYGIVLDYQYNAFI